ncbi:hypothetical protein [Thalassotalea agarivorans]|uniref:Cytochrome b562 n=1 Tax=Thalassotalea agarivorans TaxID=349064 RepID=A0A1I0AG85_THASX|nr:hypothetical protein [Thalassotalea agarivorans]SES92701.1 hypothetical protein SAMN05660429_00681 [Thalassotalea agarivorans]
MKVKMIMTRFTIALVACFSCLSLANSPNNQGQGFDLNTHRYMAMYEMHLIAKPQLKQLNSFANLLAVSEIQRFTPLPVTPEKEERSMSFYEQAALFNDKLQQFLASFSSNSVLDQKEMFAKPAVAKPKVKKQSECKKANYMS